MPTRPVLRARAAAAGRLLGAGSPLSVRPWFSAGYVLANRTGKSTHVSELDSLWSTARAWGAALPAFPDLRETVSFALPAHLDAVTVWLGAVAHLVRPSDLELRVPDPARDRTVVAQVGPGSVGVSTAALEHSAVLRGPGAAGAACHLRELVDVHTASEVFS
jgi:hypothetical protein